MSEFFDRFTSTINSDNRFNFCNQNRSDEIIIGADASQVFEIPCKKRLIESILLTYTQGPIENPLYKVSFNVPLDHIIEAKNKLFISFHLTPEDTKEFKETYLDTFCQLQITLKALKDSQGNIIESENIIYTKPEKIIVKKPL